MDTQTKVTYGSAHMGCWFDGARGIYIGDGVIREAIGHGFKCDVKPTAPVPWHSADTWTDYEFYCELWDEAEQFMDQFAAEGYWFGSNESGDWGLWECESDD